MRNSNLEESERWLAQARHDLQVARHTASGGFYSDACFYSQQAGEKALKAYGYAVGERSLLGHSLSEFRRLWGQLDTDFGALDRACRVLDRYYVAPRYPDAVPAGLPADLYDERDCEEAFAYAQQILDLVANKIAALGSEASEIPPT